MGISKADWKRAQGKRRPGTAVKMTMADVIRELQKHGLPDPVAEFKFHPKRRWRLDFCWPDYMVAIEIDGAVYTAGRHTRGKGYEGDCEKINAATILGWKVLRASTGQLAAGQVLAWLEEALGVKGR